jgi:hypothetical protein
MHVKPPVMRCDRANDRHASSSDGENSIFDTDEPTVSILSTVVKFRTLGKWWAELHKSAARTIVLQSMRLYKTIDD